MSEASSRSWWAQRRYPLLASAVALYLLIVSPFCVGLRIYLDVRTAYRLPETVRLPLFLAGAPAGLFLEAGWRDGGIAFVGWVRDLAEEHNRREPPPAL